MKSDFRVSWKRRFLAVVSTKNQLDYFLSHGFLMAFQNKVICLTKG